VIYTDHIIQYIIYLLYLRSIRAKETVIHASLTHTHTHTHERERVNDIYQQLVGVHHINTHGADRTCLQNVTLLFNTETADHPREF
jgi:hypothetical protein